MNQNLACFPPDIVRVCKLSGAEVAIKSQRLVTLKECEELLKQSIRDAQAAQDSYAFWRSAEIAARIVLVTCDLAIMILAEAAEKAGAKPAAMVVEMGYDGGKLIVDAFANTVDANKGVELLVKNKAKIGSLVAQQMGNNKVEKAISTAGNLVELGISLWEQLSGAKAGSGGGAGIASGLRTAQNQLGRIQHQIGQLEIDLENC